MGRGFFLPLGRLGQCHKPFKVCSKAVHTFPSGVQYTMIVGRERHQPNRYPFLHHNVFFLSPFLFILFFILHWRAPCFPFPPFWKTGRFPCLWENWQETIPSQHIYNLFTLFPAGWGILSMSMREAAIPSRQPTDLLFLFYPPFSNLCSEWAKRRHLVSPDEMTALSCYAATGLPLAQGNTMRYTKK